MRRLELHMGNNSTVALAGSARRQKTDDNENDAALTARRMQQTSF